MRQQPIRYLGQFLRSVIEGTRGGLHSNSDCGFPFRGGDYTNLTDHVIARDLEVPSRL